MSRTVRLLGLALIASVTTACGVPTGGPPDPIPAQQVPGDLVSPGSSAPSTPSPPARPDQPRLYLIGSDGALTPRARPLPDGDPVDQLDALLAELAAGPSSDELGDQLSSALGPGTTLELTGLDASTATVELGGTDAPDGRRSRHAVAQIVLTATSVPGIAAVVLTRAGQRIEAPLPSGELTSQALTAQDYAPFLLPTPTPTN